MSTDPRVLLGALASALGAFAEALPAREAPRSAVDIENGWGPGVTLPADPDLAQVTGAGLVALDQPLILAARRGGFWRLRDVLRSELERIERAMMIEPGDPAPSDAWRRTQPDCNQDAARSATPERAPEWNPERDETFDELDRIWRVGKYGMDVRDLRVEFADGGFICGCCNQRWPLTGWPYRCPLCAGNVAGRICSNCRSEGGGNTTPERHTRRVLIWIDVRSGREIRREWREAPHLQWSR